MPFAVQGFFDNGGPRAYVLRLVDGATPGTATLGVSDGTDNASLDAPALGLGRNPQLAIPAAGHLAGLYGRTGGRRTGGRRGVWKAPAGVQATIAGATGLDFNIIDRDQDRMNPHGLNALRSFPGAGRVVWRARTLRPTTEWRYINVRRTAMFLRRSTYNGIQWAVFEGKDETLWAALRESIGAFMDAQFRNAAKALPTCRRILVRLAFCHENSKLDAAPGGLSFPP